MTQAQAFMPNNGAPSTAAFDPALIDAVLIGDAWINVAQDDDGNAVFRMDTYAKVDFDGINDRFILGGGVFRFTHVGQNLEVIGPLESIRAYRLRIAEPVPEAESVPRDEGAPIPIRGVDALESDPAWVQAHGRLRKAIRVPGHSNLEARYFTDLVLAIRAYARAYPDWTPADVAIRTLAWLDEGKTPQAILDWYARPDGEKPR